ncbi:MAG: class I SAM-dependent methyltransferase [Pleurocapsa sp. MO_226.B13]|nr:class I SAM-dependent methyltransferase [Pleurocapsa sp. MO_226.B13]
METIDFLEKPTLDTFNEQAYLLFNPDVYESLLNNKISSGKEHFIDQGKREKRLQLNIDRIKELKKYKIAKIKKVLKEEYNQENYLEGFGELFDVCFYNFLDEDIKNDFHIVESDNISQNPYDSIALQLIEHYNQGLILDLGAGFRRFNCSNIVNHEIVKYVSTDVVSVGEKLPYKDSVFDCIFSFAVLEHIKDPFACAQEIVRCLKPGGILYSVVPHLQPYHGYPHHYYNMTHQGLANLFSNLDILHQEVNAGCTVIWSISWILQKWSNSLPSNLRKKLLKLKVSDLIVPTQDFLQLHAELVSSIPPSVQLEIASATSLIAIKPSLVNEETDVIPTLKKIFGVLNPQYFTPERLQRYLPADFNDAIYLKLNPDVAQAGINAKFHYLTYGIEEKRQYK